jgi:hypothetical protein
VFIPVLELNRPNITVAGPHVWDIHPALPELIAPGTHGIVPGINGLTGRQQGDMPVTRLAVIGQGA